MQSKILTLFQEEVLYRLFDSGLGDKGFYFTGGTALNEFYLPYRYSDDLDFFNNSEDLLLHEGWIKSILENYQYNYEVKRKNAGFLEILLNNDLILHFMTHPHKNIAKKTKSDTIIIDSLNDIAVNKILCLSRDQSKDSFDLYWILCNTDFGIDYLIQQTKEKENVFDDEMNIHELASKKLFDIPTEPVPRIMEQYKDIITPETVKAYFKDIAKNIINRYRPPNRKS